MKPWLHGWWHSRHHYDREDPQFRRVQLIETILALLQVYFFAIGVMNITVFDLPAMAVVDFIGCAIATVIMVYFRYRNNVELVAWLIVVLIGAILVIFIQSAEGRNYALYWLTIFPPVAFFLLGRKVGFYLSVVFFVYCFSFIAIESPYWRPAIFKAESLSNMLLATTILILLFRHFELTRAEAFEALERKNTQLQHLSTTDSLTGLINRSKLDQILGEQLAQAQLKSTPLCVMLMDIDFFKQINDSYGHLTGDQMLIQAAQLLQRHTHENCAIGRWGGEEFMSICPHTDAVSAGDLAESLRAAMAAHVFANELTLTVSIGIGRFRHGDSVTALVRRADEALYQAKEDGRNCVRML
ncbi:GGDEF domain-containing protein [Pseudidiomarina mangrovi]|uniref:GGDEF domain-containing protein n=1 Tax=Pseudidiomarina mangrovi TaxID=2487133 RepID=UPI000FCA0ADF|nr:diguanylate cyclase [Pseudidiomarina mangrovi]